jgi:hypothetical protein
MDRRAASFAEFWPHYLRQHARAETRMLHFIGTTASVLCLVAFLVTLAWPWLVAALVSGYLLAWIGHAFVERNRPATFTHPLWSLAADFRMWALWLAGRLGPELARAGVEARPVRLSGR